MSRTLEVRAPYDGSRIGEVACADGDETEHALASARALFVDRDAWLPLHERVAVLERTAEALATDHAMLAREAAHEGGKPLIDSQVEVTRAIDGVRLAAETIRSDAGNVIPV